MRHLLMPLMLLLTSAAHGANEETGRFQLVPGEFLFADYVTGQQNIMRTTFKIDTRTGRTWVAQGVRAPTGDGSVTYRVYWQATEDFPGQRLMGNTPENWYELFRLWAEQQGYVTQ